jgi:Rod binding domain-containing protein
MQSWRSSSSFFMTAQGIFSADIVGPGPTTSGDKSTKLHTAAEQFEALMIGEMMRSQREADGDGWLGTGSDDDNASESAMDIAESQFSNALASRGGLGLARMIERTMGPSATTQPVISANSDINTEGAR